MGNTLSSLRHWLLEPETEIATELDPSLPKPPAYVPAADPKAILQHPEETEFFRKVVPVGEAPLQDFDPGVLTSELLNLNIYEKVDNAASHGPKNSKYAGGNITEGTYAGTQAALTQIYGRIEQSYGSYFDVLAVEPTLPRFIDLAEKRDMYKYSAYPTEADGKPSHYPPHLQTVPSKDNVAQWKIFTALGLAETAIIVAKLIPDTFIGKTADWILDKVRGAVAGSPQVGLTIKDVEEYNRYHRKSGTDIARGDNIGLLSDWHSDRRFAEQCFTGTNPTSITRASPEFIKEFTAAAKANGYGAWADLLPTIDPAELLVSDCSYFREALGVAPDVTLHAKQKTSDDNWCCAPVVLFRLHDDGKLHPIAVTIDYKSTMANSVTIFNRRMGPSDPTGGEATDWPWRYAKTCAQVSDWVRHELAVHLTDAHFVEEAVIVAANRTLPMDHIVFKTLHPHWYKTLSLNAAARDSLVPQVICDIVGLSPDQAYSFIRHAFDSFDFVGSYVPNQLESRGFPSSAGADGLGSPRYKNYAYAKNMTLMWAVIRQYVASVLLTYYDKDRADAMVAEDTYVADWCREAQTAAHIKSFPTIKTFDDLVDAVTMCIHVASPFHSTVNYLQNFYQSFVIAKPPCLCAPLPSSLAQLQSYGEADLVAALPINRQREWLLAAQLPWLLSFRVASDQSLLNFALSQWSVYKKKTGPGDIEIRDISERFYLELSRLARVFYYNSKAMDDGAIPYMVMDPGVTAVSILV